LTLANLQGESYTYSWEHGIPEEVDKQGFVYEPAEANIHLVNTKSQWKPFVIVTPESNLKWDVYNHELRRDVSMFPWWNHWPTAQKPSDGRYAMEADQASHSSLSHCNWDAHSQTDESLTKIMLNGLTQQSAAQLTTLAKSWSYPAELKTGSGNGLIVEGYDQTERAYVLRLDEPNNSTKVNLELVADGDSPVLNPAFVIRNWGIADVNVTVNGNTVQQGRDLRIGYRNTLEGNDLIV